MKNFCMIKNRKTAFTLAEVLITLAVIGVIAAITLPAIINKINDTQYTRAREKALATIGEAGRLIAIEGNMNSESDAENFVKNVLSKKIKIVKMCSSISGDTLEECGISKTVKKLDDDNPIDMPLSIDTLVASLPGYSKTGRLGNKSSYGFVLANGYSVNLFFNPNCVEESNNVTSFAADFVCINAIYDMNGLRKPNRLGKDIGIVSVIYPDIQSRAVAPNPIINGYVNTSWNNMGLACSNKDKKSTPPTQEELISMAYNAKLLFKEMFGAGYLSNITYSDDSEKTWMYFFNGCGRQLTLKSSGNATHCVKR